MESLLCPIALPRPCPVCLGEGGELIFRQRFAVIPGVSLHDGYPVTACQECGAVYASRLPAQSDFDHYYTELSKYQNAEDLLVTGNTDRLRFAAIAADLAQELPWRERPILEVGCAAGGLLEALGAQGFTQIQGMDPSAACVEASQRRGLRAEQGLLVDPLGGPFAAIFAIGVLEHLRDLDPALSRIREALEPEGIVYVEVPDLAGLELGNEAPFQDFSTEHVTFFTRRSLERLMARHGFQPAFGAATLRVHGGGSAMRVLGMGYHKAPSTLPAPPRDEEGLLASRRYLDTCGERSQAEVRIMEALARSPEPLAVWGAGTLACRLMATTALGRAPIAAFVDSNPHLQDRELGGIPIRSPRWLETFSGPVLIASWGYGELIQRSLREELGLQNPVIRLDS